MTTFLRARGRRHRWIFALFAISSLCRIDVASAEWLRTRVLDPNGRPVAGARVRTNRRWRYQGAEGHYAFSNGVLTDRNGLAMEYADRLYWAGGVREVTAPGFAPLHLPFEVQDSSVTVRVVRGAKVLGRVSRDGHGVPGVQVRLLRRESKLSFDQFDGEAVTDAKGEYRFEHVEPRRRCWVFVPMGSSQGLGAFRAESLLAGRDGSVTTAPELRWGEGRTISGRVSFPAGVQAPAAERCRVRLVRMIDDPSSAMSVDGRDVMFAPVDDEGRFSFRDVPEESLWIRPDIPGFRLSDSLAAPLQHYGFGGARVDIRGGQDRLVLPVIVQRHGEQTFEGMKANGGAVH